MNTQDKGSSTNADLINSLVARITEIEVSTLPLKAAVDALRACDGNAPLYGAPSAVHTLPRPGDTLTVDHEVCEVVEVCDHVVHYAAWDDDAEGAGEPGRVSLDVWYAWIDLPGAVLKLR